MEIFSVIKNIANKPDFFYLTIQTLHNPHQLWKINQLLNHNSNYEPIKIHFEAAINKAFVLIVYMFKKQALHKPKNCGDGAVG